ncbi:hypothetical protein P7C70_g7339, partial [Phenoliferia sp. Uapishka_3]
MGSYMSHQPQPPPHHVHRHSSLSEESYVQPMHHSGHRTSSLSMNHPIHPHLDQRNIDNELRYAQEAHMEAQQAQQARRTSMSSQMQQNQGGMYGGGGGGGYPGAGRPMQQSSGPLPSVTHSPPDGPGGDLRGSHQPSQNPSALPPAQAAWARAGPLPPSAHHPSISRHNSTSSLDPASAYGQGHMKDMGGSPYSRSPELRVSHKLAERKRRKEMAQLFDELRDALPVDRGLKSSKWEILSKAVDYILSLKEHNSELTRDNTMLRDHFGLPPGPQATSVNTSSHSPPAPDSSYSSSQPAPPSRPHPPAPPSTTHQQAAFPIHTHASPLHTLLTSDQASHRRESSLSDWAKDTKPSIDSTQGQHYAPSQQSQRGESPRERSASSNGKRESQLNDDEEDSEDDEN